MIKEYASLVPLIGPFLHFINSCKINLRLFPESKIVLSFFGSGQIKPPLAKSSQNRFSGGNIEYWTENFKLRTPLQGQGTSAFRIPCWIFKIQKEISNDDVFAPKAFSQ